MFAVLNVFFHDGSRFRLMRLLQTVNVSSAAGDFIVACKMARMPKAILVNDTGLCVTVFAPCRSDDAQGAEDKNANAVQAADEEKITKKEETV